MNVDDVSSGSAVYLGISGTYSLNTETHSSCPGLKRSYIRICIVLGKVSKGELERVPFS